MILILAEKPSLARNITAAIGGMKKRDGYYEGAQYIVTWAFGHLFSLADIEDYNPAPQECRHWTMDNLPCFQMCIRDSYGGFRFRSRSDG